MHVNGKFSDNAAKCCSKAFYEILVCLSINYRPDKHD